MTQLPVALRSPISLPEGRAGKFQVRHRMEQTFDVISMREGLLTGQMPKRIKTTESICIHELHHDEHGLWIADLPIEIRQHKEALTRMWTHGRVLVGGLGLGIAATLLAKMPQVEAIDVVEISPEVAELCDPHHPKVNVIVKDLHKFLTETKWKWDSAFIDIWLGTNEGAWWENVFPIRRLIGQRFGKWHADRVVYWAEDIMLGQVGMRLMATPATPHWYYKEGLRLPMSKQRARWVIQNVGTPLWEKRYGALYPKETP